jgi:hypothetical protein
MLAVGQAADLGAGDTCFLVVGAFPFTVVGSGRAPTPAGTSDVHGRKRTAEVLQL